MEAGKSVLPGGLSPGLILLRKASFKFPCLDEPLE
jgi:hypothetical protein